MGPMNPLVRLTTANRQTRASQACAIQWEFIRQTSGVGETNPPADPRGSRPPCRNAHDRHGSDFDTADVADVDSSQITLRFRSQFGLERRSNAVIDGN